MRKVPNMQRALVANREQDAAKQLQIAYRKQSEC